ncbi:endonuclease/exonuclease/phosphatase family protein [Pontibacter sp. 172403-2]|uniref:endonuclease/exonuclease/phosphatase family protein n=1 Tax=Pontibacter rufus TaxID=2791028 RepID=UPI0018AFF80B|nr:endonuclease/exonuclease/phosphatase family protein [Pontibacter sp. 172403-2]MBF9252735.1 endonuclease/exonuclease/phosphatase family protein [Pontibacter sp. 172403-2]
MGRRILFYLIIAAGTLCVLLTMASLPYNTRFWFLKVLDFLREQTLIACLICLAGFVAVNRRWATSAVLLVIGLVTAAALQAIIILPYTPIWPKAAPDASPAVANRANTVGLLIANVLMKNRNAAGFLEIVHKANPDLVLAMETNQWWANQLQPLKERYPYTILYPLDNTYGMLLYSRLPLRDAHIRFLQHDSVPSFQVEARLPGGSWFILHTVHPVPPVPSPYPDNVGKEGRKEVVLLKVGEMVAAHTAPTIVAGDFNDVAWSNTSRLFGQKSKLNDVRVGRGFYNSFDATSLIRRWPLDQIYASGHFRVLELKRLPKYGSDHFPIYVQLVLQPPGK